MWRVPCGSFSPPWRGFGPTARSPRRSAPVFGTSSARHRAEALARIVGSCTPARPCGRCRTGSGGGGREIPPISELHSGEHGGHGRGLYGQPPAGEDVRHALPAGRGVMPYDCARPSGHGLEQEVAYQFPIQAQGRELQVKFAGIADRIDALDGGTLRGHSTRPGRRIWSSRGWRAFFTARAN